MKLFFASFVVVGLVHLAHAGDYLHKCVPTNSKSNLREVTVTDDTWPYYLLTLVSVDSNGNIESKTYKATYYDDVTYVGYSVSDPAIAVEFYTDSSEKRGMYFEGSKRVGLTCE